MLRVVIPEPIPSKNKGELAILEGIREALSFCGKHELTVYSPSSRINDDKNNSNGNYHVVNGIDLFGPASGRMHFFNRWGILLLFSIIHRLSKNMAFLFFKDSLLQAIGNADLIIAGHDGMLGPDHFYLALASKIMKKPLALYGGGSGMQGRQKFRTRQYLKFLVTNAIICTVRDPGARTLLTLNDVQSERIHVFPDPAVLLKPCEDSRVREILKTEGVPLPEETPLYGLIPVRAGIVFRTSFSSQRDLKKKHELRVQFWKDALVHLLKTTNAHFVFIPHCTGPDFSQDDRRMSRDIYDAIPGQKSRFALIDTEYSASELKGIMRHCDFVLGERAHGLIGAVSAGTPCIALTTEEDLRMHCIMEKVLNRITFNLNNPDINDLKSLLTNEWRRRDQTAVVMKRKAAEIHAEATRAAELLSRRVSDAIGDNV